MTTTTLLQLTLIVPRALEDMLADALLASEPPLPGWTLIQVHGHGGDFRHASVRERVRGRLERSQFTLLLGATQAEALLQALRQRFSAGSLHWWSVPVLAEGRL